MSEPVEQASTFVPPDARQGGGGGLDCRHCGVENAFANIVCDACGRSLAVAYLLSEGEGVIPDTHCFPLCRRGYAIGNTLSCDYVIPTLNAGVIVLDYYGMDRFQIRPPGEFANCRINEATIDRETVLRDGMRLRLGADSFMFWEGEPPDALDMGNRPEVALPANEFFAISGALLKIIGCKDLNKVCEIAVDTVLRVTGMTRGIFFLTDTDDEGELILRQCTTRTIGADNVFVNVDEPFRFTQSLLQRSLMNGGTIVIDDARKRAKLPDTMVELDLHSVACIPVVYSQTFDYTLEDCLGIIYADSFLPANEIHGAARPMLTLLANCLASLIMNWHQ